MGHFVNPKFRGLDFICVNLRNLRTYCLSSLDSRSPIKSFEDRFHGNDPDLQVLLDEPLIILGADDMRAVAVKLHADGVMGDAQRYIPEIIIRDAPESREP